MYSFTGYCIFICIVSHATAQEQEVPTSYEGAQVWRTKLRDSQDILTIKKLFNDQDIQLWKLEPNQADFLVQESEKVKVNRVLSGRKLSHSVLIMDVQRRVNSLKMAPSLWNENSLRIGHRLNWKEYPTFTIIDEYLIYLTENFASICNVTIIGYTAENRTIKLVKVSNGNPLNKGVLITAGSHAREWVSITTALYVLDTLVTKFDQLPGYMKSIDWSFVPAMNPDGYEYSHTHDRLWRKNRRKLNTCRGVDINRNFDIDFDISGIADKKECYEAYAGPYAFSEAESIAIRDMIRAALKKPKVMIDLHAYGQLILYPWSAKSEPTPDRTLLSLTANEMAQAIFNSSGVNYKFGATYHMIYPATGASIDWMYSVGVVRSFGIHLRDTGDHGFLLPSEYIEPTGMELLAAVRELARGLAPEAMRRTGTRDAWFR